MDTEQNQNGDPIILKKIAAQLIEAVPRLTQIISTEAQASGTAGPLTITQLRVLGLLTRGPKLPSELARELRITPASTSEVVDLLVRRGLVERCEQPQDRRLCLLKLTTSGAERLSSAKERALAALMRMLARLEPADLLALERGTELLLEALRRDGWAADGHEPS